MFVRVLLYHSFCFGREQEFSSCRRCTPFRCVRNRISHSQRKAFRILAATEAVQSLTPAKQKCLKRHFCFAGVQGFEPRLKASKASVLPLDDTPNSDQKSIPNIHEKSRSVYWYKFLVFEDCV